jgi:folylpolyglutamate synthase
MASSERTYGEALKLLDSLQSNRAVVSTISDTSRDMNQDAIPEMLEWTRKAGYEVSDFAKRGLRCVHVAGTKGKGSVCAMVENILLQYRGENEELVEGKCTLLRKVGLYTSPHLVEVRERIRIDGSPISEPLFTRYFFELWDRFSDVAANGPGPNSDSDSPSAKPGYFRYLTILALHTFMKEGVESAIIECGIGGEYDSTNILPSDAVTVSAITRLGIDHTGMLGDTIGKIAWHKAGIMKEGVPTFTVEQVAEAQAVLDVRSQEKGVQLEVVNRNPLLESGKTKLGLEGDFQKDNASIAIAVAAQHLRSLHVPDIGTPQSSDTLPSKFITGLETVRWAGRCEVREEGKIQWLIDGAHTLDSIHATAEWYASKYLEARNSNNPPTATMLIFNQQDRDSKMLITELISAIRSPRRKISDLDYVLQRATVTVNPPISHRRLLRINCFTYAAFCTNTPFKKDVPKGTKLKLQEQAARVYEQADSNTLHMCYGSVEEAVQLARKVSKGDERVLVLVTGSLHLVGGLLQVLNRDHDAGDHGEPK